MANAGHRKPFVWHKDSRADSSSGSAGYSPQPFIKEEAHRIARQWGGTVAITYANYRGQ